mmetsp:Transcript_53331/g.159723  ORF Transcript_53331/g.159723 Transcript_53331/m.159723 type:complete len:90 (+) Transcript_53331:410-679(+)
MSGKKERGSGEVCSFILINALRGGVGLPPPNGRTRRWGKKNPKRKLLRHNDTDADGNEREEDERQRHRQNRALASLWRVTLVSFYSVTP